jgi:tetratricopeptide (TPR) repeat protein
MELAGDLSSGFYFVSFRASLEGGPQNYRSSGFFAVCPKSIVRPYSPPYTGGRKKGGFMRNWILISIASIILAVGGLSASQQDAKQLTAKGHSVFLEVLGGDESKIPEAIRYMEEARELDPTSVRNLYNLGRLRFFEVITLGRRESLAKSEEVFARILELDPNKTEALSFHGSVLTLQGGGRDIAKFMQGAGEMKAALQKSPNNINNLIVMAFTARNFPPVALAAMGNYNPLKDLENVSGVFDGQVSHYAPHADVVMKAFLGESFKLEGDNEKARASFEAALAVPKPTHEGARAGREILTAAITARMNGGEKPLFGNPLFTGCHSCHLSAPDKLPAR